MDVMLDLETLGTTPGSVIVAIGLFPFGPFLRELTPLSINVDPKSCEKFGLRCEASTVEWWMAQGDAARQATFNRELPIGLPEALTMVSDFVRSVRLRAGGIALWANGPSFDCALLGAAYRAVDIQQPWGHREERCVRTILNLVPFVTIVHDGISHTAIDDARAQARAVKEAQEAIALGRAAFGSMQGP